MRDQAIANQQYEYAAELREREVRLQTKLEELEAEVEQEREAQHPVVGEDDIRDVISQWTGVPLSRIAAEESQRELVHA